MHPAKATKSILQTVLICWLATLVLGLLSDGVHHDDDLVHFLMARWAWWYPGYLLHVWGRAGLTVPMATVTWIPDVETAWHAARILSSIVSAASALIAARLAMHLDIKKPWRVVLACYLQPLFTVLGYTTLTENFTALYLIAGVSLLARGRSVVASMVFSLALLTRHEAVMFVPIWLAALFWRRSSTREFLVSAAASLWAPIVHNVLFRWAFGDWPIRIFFEPSGSTQYLPTGWAAYLPDALYAMTPTIFVLCVVGGFSLFRWTLRERSNSARSHFVTQSLLLVIPASFFLVHAVITATGIYGSGGFGRFMVAIAPFVAILAVMGWERLSDAESNAAAAGRSWLMAAAVWCVIWIACETELAAGQLPIARHDFILAGRIILICISVIFSTLFVIGKSAGAKYATLFFVLALSSAQALAMCRPLKPGEKQKAVATLVQTLEKLDLGQGPIFAADAWFAYALGLVENPRATKDAKLLASMPNGTMLIWDETYSGSDYHGLSLADLMQSGAYRERTSDFRLDASQARFRVFEKTRPTPIPEKIRPSYPPPMRMSGPPVRGIFYLRDPSRPRVFPQANDN